MGDGEFSALWLLPTRSRTQQNLVIEKELSIDYLKNMREDQGEDYTRYNSFVTNTKQPLSSHVQTPTASQSTDTDHQGNTIAEVSAMLEQTKDSGSRPHSNFSFA